MSMQRWSKVRVTYLLTSVTSDRVCAALQIIHQSRSIIVEATGRQSEGGMHVSAISISLMSTQKHPPWVEIWRLSGCVHFLPSPL